MIRINLLDADRKTVARKAPFDPRHAIAAGCICITALGGLGIGWRFWLVQRESARLDEALATAQQETTRLHTVIAQVQQFEQRKAQLQQRVTLIEQLRKEQTGPVHMLDQISLALPPTVWLTEMKQTDAASDILIDGQSLSLTGLSDFVTNLESSGYFQRSVEIVSTTTDTKQGARGEVIKFQIKAVFKNPLDPAQASASANGSDGRSTPQG